MNTGGMATTTVRLTRQERKERTRADLLRAARVVFERRGFHGASLDEIAEEAGYTKGAVYSNFASKDDLFLAVLEHFFEERRALYRSFVLDQKTLEGAVRAVARFWREANERDPEWARVLSEFLVHASRHEPLRVAANAVRERTRTGIASLIAELGRRHGVEFVLPPEEIARGSAALNRGLALEQLLDPGLPARLFEEQHAAYIRGLIVQPARKAGRR